MSNVYFRLLNGNLLQDWSNASLITTDDNWSGVPSIEGFRGDGITASTGVDPRTLLVDGTVTLDVNANQTNPNTFTTGGVAEFAIANPVVALQGSGTAAAPHLLIYLDATGRQDVRVQFDARDIDGSADNATQQLAVQYRIGSSGNWTNVPGGYIADASTGPSLATLVTHVDVTLPADANNQAQVQVRIITSNAVGSDEWIGIDNIDVSSIDVVAADTTPPVLLSSSPADNAVGVAAGADIVLTFNEVVQAGSGDITITDGAGDVRVITLGGAADPDATVTFSGSTVTINLTTDLAPGTAYDVLVAAGAIRDAAGNAFAGIALDALDFTTLAPNALTPIYTIQGAGHRSAYAGQQVTSQGVVTAIVGNGFYMQDATGDGDFATSDGIFVFTSSAPGVVLGHLVQVRGNVAEFTPSGAAAGSRSITEITGPMIQDLGVGATIAPTQIGGSAGRSPPTTIIDDAGSLVYDPVNHGNDFYESLEGMLVRVKTPVAVSPTNSFGEIFTIVDNDDNPANGRNTNSLTERGSLGISGGAADFGRTDTVGGDFNPERIQIDDGAGFVTPQVNVGAQLGDVVGVVNYSFGNYEVIATQAVSVTAASTLTAETTALVGGGARLTIGNYNVANLDPGDGAPRFTTLAGQIVNNLLAPDILALQEIQDNSGPTDNGVTSASVTLQMLVDAIFTASGGAVIYAFQDNPFIGNDINGGEPGGNIRTAFLYRTDHGVSLVGGSLRTIDANGQATTTVASNSDPTNPFNGSRLPLAADFTYHGQSFTVIDNHFTSKGGSGALMGDQPPVDGGEVQRAGQAQAVNTYVDSLLAADPHARVVISGDLNEFEFEQPLQVLAGTATYQVATYTAGGTRVLNALVETLPANQRYDYIFDGNAQSLDHIFVADRALVGTRYDIVHINAEFAVQASDHDALVASFSLGAPRHDQGGDGMADILWRNVNGDTWLYAMNGNQQVAGGGFIANIAGDWSVAGVADFTGDGRADILWRNVNGDTWLYAMNGNQQVAGGGFIGNVAGGWSVAGVGDFTADGRADILWRNVNGDTWLYAMNGNQQVAGGGFIGNVADGWSVAGVADFSGDGCADILWRNTSGDVWIYAMNGNQQVAGGGFVGNIGAAWSVASLDDFNNDGYADILWRNSNGDTWLYLMQGSQQIAGGGFVGSIGNEWSVVA